MADQAEIPDWEKSQENIVFMVLLSGLPMAIIMVAPGPLPSLLLLVVVHHLLITRWLPSLPPDHSEYDSLGNQVLHIVRGRRSFENGKGWGHKRGDLKMPFRTRKDPEKALKTP